jgi:hypothetical protein
MSIIPCQENADLGLLVEDFAEILKTESHTLGTHGLSETDFYQGGLFRASIERIRGQFSATMGSKREFVQHVLNHMREREFIRHWKSAGERNRHDYTVYMPSGRVSVIELKGCLDGNNTNIFERPPHAQEFTIWSVCTNPGADPRHNVWSGIHSRLSTEIIEKEKQVDGPIVWDWLCGTVSRPCPKLDAAKNRQMTVGPFQLTPPCIYLFPGTIPSVRNNPDPNPQSLQSVELLSAMHRCFGCTEDEINYVRFAVSYRGSELVRTTTVQRAGIVQRVSESTPIRRR